MLIIHDYQLVLPVNVNLQGVSDDHFSYEFGYLLRCHLEHFRQGHDAERLVLARCSEEESLKSSFFEVDCKHFSQLFRLNLRHTLEERNGANMLDGCFPVRFIKSTGCEDDTVSVLLSSKMEGTAIVELNQSLETAADNSLVHGVLVLSVVGDLEHHSADEVTAVKNLQVNLHVEGDLSLVLLKLILTSFVQLSAEALSKEFLVLGVVANIGK